MNLELSGKLISILPEVSGEGKNGPWKKQEFILETPGDFPKKVCISVWGEKVGDLQGFQEGDTIKASINIESREYNNRWYTDVRAWRLEKSGEGTQEPGALEIPPPSLEDLPSDGGDDLPF
jgi:hypothetical protein